MAAPIFVRRDLFSPFLFLLVFSLIVIVLASCASDTVFEELDSMNDPTSDLFIGNISGKVLNEDLEPLGGVNIQIRGEEVVTDENGFFSVQGIELDAHGTLIKASLESYWPITKMVSLSKSQQNLTRIILSPKTEIRNLEASTGGVVNFNGTIKIDFPADAFVSSNGLSYQGEVEVSVIYLDPKDENVAMMSPGDLRAFNASNELQTLLSLGMAGVTLKGADNETLTLKTNKRAILSIKAPQVSNEADVPLWHFDEASGYWLEEGVAEREGDFLVGEVSHFSWWNYGIPFYAVKLSGALINDAGIGIAGLPVSIFMVDPDQNLGTEFTGDEGIFCGWIPKDQNLIIQIKNECGVVFYEEAIGPFSEDTELAPIPVTWQNVIEVCGTLVNCDAEPVTNGYLVVQYDGYSTFIPVEANGNFCAAVNICESTMFGVYGIDLTTVLQGLVSTFDLADSPINNLELSACDQITTLFRFQIDNEPEILISDFKISMDQGGLLIAGASSEVNGVVPGFIIDGINWGTSDFNFGYSKVLLASPLTLIDCDVFLCNDPSIEVVEFGGIGNPISLNIYGTSDYFNNYIINVIGILEPS